MFQGDLTILCLLAGAEAPPRAWPLVTISLVLISGECSI